MTSSESNFALIGRAFPCDAFQLWSKVSRERRRFSRNTRAGTWQSAAPRDPVARRQVGTQH